MTDSTLSQETHRWKFFRAGGFDQVHLENGSDLTTLDQLDPKLWVALSCPARGVELDSKTLELIDTDGDGRIRVPEIIEAVKWTTSLLDNPDDLIKRSPELPLSSINTQSPEGQIILDSAKHILANLGKENAAAVTVEDTTDTARIFSHTKFNGDGIIPADASDDPEIRRIIDEIIECMGAEIDRSEKQGVSQVKVDRFFNEAEAYSDWWKKAATDENAVFLLGKATLSAAETFNAVKAKISDYFLRCRLAAFDDRALSAVNRQETEYVSFADRNLSPDMEEIASFPLSRIEIDKPLSLREKINPAWASRMNRFVSDVVAPLLGEKPRLSESEWEYLASRFAAYESWLSGKTGTAVEKLGIERIREILGGNGKEVITDLIAKDQMLEPEFNSIATLDKLVRYHRDLFTLLNNFVSFSDFYTRRGKAIFQAGTLYLDGRSCDLCIRVDDPDKHAALATLSRTYLVYCDCSRKGGTDRMNIAAAFTVGDSDFLMVGVGDSDFLMVGRNGVFFDRQGQDWDATIVRIIEHPISIRQAFWTPYKRIMKMIGEQVEKLAAARAKAVTEKGASGVMSSAQHVAAGKPAAPVQPFDIAKFAGIFAAIGLAIGAIGTAIVAAVTGFVKLAWWQMPLAILAIILLISVPSMIIAWMKLSQRNLGPLLDANGWAVNTRARINIPFGSSLTRMAVLPEGSERSLQDPFAEKKRRWPYYILAFIILLIILLFTFNRAG
jgi:hypothetical protein